MSKDSNQKSPYGAGFIAACIVVGAVLVCGALMLIGGRTSPATTSLDRAQPNAAETDPARGAVSARRDSACGDSARGRRARGACDSGRFDRRRAPAQRHRLQPPDR